MFFEFNQNNSGGRLDIDDDVTHRVFIEADNAEKAIKKAKEIGIYFDGCDNGTDCTCCGDRWYRVDNRDAIKFPKVYGILKLTSNKAIRCIVKRYNTTITKTDPHRSDPHRSRLAITVLFHDITSYAQFLADFYGYATPDAYIYRKDGTKESIFKKKQEYSI